MIGKMSKFLYISLISILLFGCDNEFKNQPKSDSKKKDSISDSIQNSNIIAAVKIPVCGLNDFNIGPYRFHSQNMFCLYQTEGSDYSIYSITQNADTLILYFGNNADIDHFLTQYIGHRSYDELRSTIIEKILINREFVINNEEFKYEITLKNNFLYWMKVEAQTNICKELIIENLNNDKNGSIIQVFGFSKGMKANNAMLQSLFKIDYSKNENKM